MRKIFNNLKSYFKKKEDNNETICYCFNISRNNIVKQVVGYKA